MTNVVISQSNYIPWLGFFGLLNECDSFIILDDVQFTRRDWRNRNIIQQNNKNKWLTIPLMTKSTYRVGRVMDMKVANPCWSREHFAILSSAYRSRKFWAETSQHLHKMYQRSMTLEYLTDINVLFLKEICKILEITCTFHRSTDLISIAELDEFDASQRLVKLSKLRNATTYLSGPSAKNYLNLELFTKNNINVQYANYEGLTDGSHLEKEMFKNCSIIDVLANYGIDRTRSALKNCRLEFDIATG